jgi:thiol:disulfide interchange protein
MIKGSYYRATDSGSETTAENPEVSKIAWINDFEQARRLSKETGKPMLIDFTASWCPPCQVMKHEVWSAPEVVALVEKGYIPVLLDIDRQENQTIAQNYSVSSIPAIFVTDAQGRTLRHAAYMTPSQTSEFLAAGRGPEAAK